ncbi:hypothetical protein [Actinobacillus vicugnae]|uniref:hypothetical protein n=1 Tax=Actinobacillus vicugnae TaxID=2573093 RepID=UPI00123F148D|nr:hypothetical protein [Actinobacillus vicugnae]
MEWQGIDLNDSRRKHWLQRSYRQLSSLLFILIFAIGIALYLQFNALQINQQNRPLVNQNQQLKAQLDHLNSRLMQQKNPKIQHFVQTLTEKQIIDFLNLLQKLPLPQGGIEQAILIKDPEPIMKLTGVLANSSQFEQLEKYLSAQELFHFSLVNLQISEKNQVEFSLNILFKE